MLNQLCCRMLTYAALLYAGFLQTAYADVEVKITDLNNREMQVTYSFVYTQPGSSFITLPENGFEFARGRIKVVSVVDSDSGAKLAYDIVKPPKGDPKLEAVKIKFSTPVPRGGRYKIKLTVSAKTDFINQLSADTYEFGYKTGHASFFELPTGHALTYTSQPVILFQRNKRTIVQAKPESQGYFIYNTRSYGKNTPLAVPVFSD